MKDLFGVEITEKDYLAGGMHRLSVYERRKMGMGYRLAHDKSQWCKLCGHHFEHLHGRIYHKCELIGNSCCEATVIRVKHTCDRWEKIL